MAIESDLEVIEPDLPIIDSQHHLWVHAGRRYLIDEFQADLASGHNVIASVYMECGAMYRKHGPSSLRTVGEAEFVAGTAAMSESGSFGPTRICTAFVGAADLTLGAEVDGVLDALGAASGGRLRGIRGAASWDADPAVHTGLRPMAPQGLLRDPRFRAGFARLGARGLVYDAFQYHPQLGDLCDLADAFPNTPIVVGHCGGLLGIGPYAVASNFVQWKNLVGQIARRPNTFMKLGGLGGRRCGFGFERRHTCASAAELARSWRPYIETCIELFSPARCMYESNFPQDSASGNYRTVWNALKRTASTCTAAEKSEMFHGTAGRVYRIDLPPPSEPQTLPVGKDTR